MILMRTYPFLQKSPIVIQPGRNPVRRIQAEFYLLVFAVLLGCGGEPPPTSNRPKIPTTTTTTTITPTTTTITPTTTTITPTTTTITPTTLLNPADMGFNNIVHTIVPIEDGRLYIGGAFTQYGEVPHNRLIRLNANGTADMTFNMGSGFENVVYALAEAPNKDIYVGGDFNGYQTAESPSMIRLNPDGTIDITFDVSDPNDSGFDGAVRAFAMTSDGNIYVGGEFGTYKGKDNGHIIQLDAKGDPVPGFHTNEGFDDIVSAIASAGDGRIYVGGDFTSYYDEDILSERLIRLNANGTVDTAFDIGTGFEEIVRVIVPTGEDGDLYVGGDFTTYNGTTSQRLIRLKADGTVDKAFYMGTGFNNTVHTVALASDGRGNLYVGGDFTTYNGTASQRLIRLKTDGTVDKTFDIGMGFDNTVHTVALASDGSGDLYVGGAFTTYKGLSAKNIIRLQANGLRR